MNDRFYPSRRKFLGQLSCAAIGSSTLFSSLISLKAFNAAAAANGSNDGDDYRALVCVFQSGGNDSFNMLVPTSASEYAEYRSTRSNLAIAAGDLLPINVANTPGRTFGVHPALSPVQQLFDAGKLSFISNVGTMVQPTTKQDYFNEASHLPLGLFSHSDQIHQWQTSLPHERSSAAGWGGKVADLIRDMNTSTDISMNVSLSGTNVFQTGAETIEYAIDPNDGSVGIEGYGADNMYDVFNITRGTAIDNLIDHEYQDIFQKTYVDVIRRSRDGHILFNSALESVGALSTAFADNSVSQSFHMVARTIAARSQLGMKRQIFFINFGGWDHHDELLNNQFGMLNVLGNALGEFDAALQELNMSDCVTTFSISEFGRTLTSNGNGTDHAWGGNVMVMGGAQLNGGRIFGDYPTLALDSSLELGDGVLVPTISTDQYFAELAEWFGVSKGELATIFPNLENFYDVQSNDLPIGFLNV